MSGILVLMIKTPSKSKILSPFFCRKCTSLYNLIYAAFLFKISGSSLITSHDLYLFLLYFVYLFTEFQNFPPSKAFLIRRFCYPWCPVTRTSISSNTLKISVVIIFFLKVILSLGIIKRMPISTQSQC